MLYQATVYVWFDSYILSSLHALPVYNHNEQLKLQGSLHAVPGYMCGFTAAYLALCMHFQSTTTMNS